jgi:hypothetical protein
MTAPQQFRRRAPLVMFADVMQVTEAMDMEMLEETFGRVFTERPPDGHWVWREIGLGPVTICSDFAFNELFEPVPVPSEWVSVETAPKDGTVILGCIADEFDGGAADPWPLWQQGNQWRAPVSIAWRPFHVNAPGKAQWRLADGRPYSPTHWKPLPDPPPGDAR